MRFPSMEWVRALVAEGQKEPEITQVTKEWGGRSVGVVITAGKGLAEDFCVYAKPHTTKPELIELKQCEDEDDLELEEPDFFFKVSFDLAQQLLRHEVDPFALLNAGKVRADGDMRFLVPFSHKWQALGQRVGARLANRG